MRTARLLPVSPNTLCSWGGCTCPGVYLPGGCTCWGCTCPRGPDWGVYLPGGVYLPRGCTCLGGILARGCTCQGGVHLALGVYLPGGWPGQGVYLGGVPTEGGTCLGTPPSLWTEWQTGAKILPCPKLCLQVVTRQHSNRMHTAHLPTIHVLVATIRCQYW